ncbi:hypothetical protein GUJ93_ZPchr0010g10376 [Zizania palustris]|uniref:Late embryogenesis abundant protein LEA-2 subgroup domain-containing protein n=1 Tax=Zizania palustris TaxID=103762 RepID=A0A8J5W9Y6_ZIZPA|nr:hypothetical protein GUJ93_ZPchr0010g10376 [Zizania palustris]
MAASCCRWLMSFCSLVTCIVSVVVCVVVAAGLAALVLYLLFRPHLIHATAASVDLTTFSLAPKAWTLRYNLSLALDLRNPNSRVALLYHAVAADAYYQDQRFSHAGLPDFSQPMGSSDTTHISPVAFQGQYQLVGGIAAAAFRREATEGMFSIHVSLAAKTNLQMVGVIRLPGPDLKVDCPLRVQRRSASAPPPHVHPTACHVTY